MGVILNLAVWFGLNVVFAEVMTVSSHGLRLSLPVLSSIDPAAAALAALALVAVFRLRLGTVPVLTLCAGIGLVIWRWRWSEVERRLETVQARVVIGRAGCLGTVKRLTGQRVIAQSGHWRIRRCAGGRPG